MSNLTRVRSDKSYLGDELACYLQSEVSTLVLPDLQALATGYNGQYKAQKFDYQLPLGRLQLIELVVYLPKDIVAGYFENVRKTAIESLAAWQNHYLTKHKDNVDATMYVVVFDIQFKSAYQNTKERTA